MIGTGQNISSIGATHYVPYSAIELVGNIQLTAGIAAISLMMHILIVSAFDLKDPPKFYTNAWGTLVCISLATLVISTLLRIWL